MVGEIIELQAARLFGRADVESAYLIVRIAYLLSGVGMASWFSIAAFDAGSPIDRSPRVVPVDVEIGVRSVALSTKKRSLPDWRILVPSGVKDERNPTVGASVRKFSHAA